MMETNDWHFTKREEECISLLLAGYTMKSAAVEMGISPRTVESHIESMKEKTGAYSRAALMAIVCEKGY